MSFDSNRKHKKSPSFHEKQMRFWTILLVVLLAVLFALGLYMVNLWSNPLTR